MLSFSIELRQLLFSCLLLEDLKSAAMVSKRWHDTGEVLKLWEDKKVANQDDDSILCYAQGEEKRDLQHSSQQCVK